MYVRNDEQSHRDEIDLVGGPFAVVESDPGSFINGLTARIHINHK